MGDNQSDAYAERRAQLEERFKSLPPAGGSDYWQHIEESDIARQLPLEVLARCCRERIGAGAMGDAHRIFDGMTYRIRAYIGKHAQSTVRQTQSGTGSLDPEDLEQECYMKLWEELATDGPTFLLESFFHTLEYIFDHVAESQTIKAAVRKRQGVVKPNRVPRGQMKSIDAEPTREGESPLALQLVSMHAQEDLDLAEYSDLLAEIEKLPRDERAIIRALFFEGRTQEDIAQELGVTDRTIRTRLKKILQKLRARYEGSEGGSNV